VNIHYSCFYKKFDQLGVCAPWGIWKLELQ
jgi:hypothetical protein